MDAASTSPRPPLTFVAPEALSSALRSGPGPRLQRRAAQRWQTWALATVVLACSAGMAWWAQDLLSAEMRRQQLGGLLAQAPTAAPGLAASAVPPAGVELERALENTRLALERSSAILEATAPRQEAGAAAAEVPPVKAAVPVPAAAMLPAPAPAAAPPVAKPAPTQAVGAAASGARPAADAPAKAPVPRATKATVRAAVPRTVPAPAAAPSPAARPAAEAAAREAPRTGSPRAACGSASGYALLRCMQQQCSTGVARQHAQCRTLHEERRLPS